MKTVTVTLSMDSTSPAVSTSDVTSLLKAWSSGDASALDQLTPLVYAELHRQARLLMSRERRGHVLQPSALVNEAFVRLTRDSPIEWENRRQFFAVSAGLMRQVLTDFARSHGAVKRGAGAGHLNINSLIGDNAQPDQGVDLAQLIDIDEALTRLAALDQRQARVVELRFFGGLDIAEAAAVLNVSEATVVRDWRMARAWLHNALHPRS